jgi:hypothetical protein
MNTFKPNDLALVVRVPGGRYQHIIPGEIVTYLGHLGDVGLDAPACAVRRLNGLEHWVTYRTLRPLPPPEENDLLQDAVDQECFFSGLEAVEREVQQS